MTLFHEEQRFSSVWSWLLIVVLDVPFILILLLAREPALILGVIIVSTIALLFRIARLSVDVTPDEIVLAFHFMWPTRRVRIADVARAQATRYNALLDYGGYGVRLGPQGWAFNAGGGEGVLVETKDGKRLMIGSRRANELQDAIAKAVRPSAGSAAALT